MMLLFVVLVLIRRFQRVVLCTPHFSFLVHPPLILRKLSSSSVSLSFEMFFISLLLSFSPKSKNGLPEPVLGWQRRIYHTRLC